MAFPLSSFIFSPRSLSSLSPCLYVQSLPLSPPFFSLYSYDQIFRVKDFVSGGETQAKS